ncbi:MAG: hypothetical protein GXO85_14310 [Chlorobi bacterium]|nr:hypothetical protein [Chlorobiota bacterium]
MALTNKQKNYIKTYKGKLSSTRIAKNLRVPVEQVRTYSRSLGRKKYPFYYNLILIAIPFIAIFLLEYTLDYFDYGREYNQWETVDNQKMMLTTEIAFRYFYQTESIPYPAQDLFDIKKKPGAIRVFILGGSSAAGYPFSPNGSFSKYIRKRLELVYPYKTIEVINCAMTAINSYSLLDMLPGILEQKPDILLIYAGHNEYYGALGAGSLETLGNSRGLVNFMLSINHYKTIQLIRDVIQDVIRLFSSNEKRTGTLMSRMAKEQSIEINSDTYKVGINQFEGNLRDMLKMAKKANVKVILSDLTCNLKDQPPFISIDRFENESANAAYELGQEILKNGDNKDALQFFVRAKDLDALRFRAPSEMNKIIYKLADEFNYPVVKADSTFNALSKDGIVGNNLMTDHLHPTLDGYQILGKLFFDKMLDESYLPAASKVAQTSAQQDLYVRANYDFTKLDSTIGRYRITILKNDWPFVKNLSSPSNVLRKLNLHNYSDSLALFVLENKLTWEKAHRNLANRYLQRGDVDNYLKEMDDVIFQYPFVYDFYDMVINNLLQRKMFDRALPYLEKYDRVKATAFTAKWIGIIELSKNNISRAIKYLEKSTKINSFDDQVYFNLAGAYSLNKEYKKALSAIDNCLMINPNYKGARSLQGMLLKATEKQ